MRREGGQGSPRGPGNSADNSVGNARSNGSTRSNGSSVWREVITHMEAQASPLPATEHEVVLSLSMVNQLKEELAREVRKIVREELWRPLSKGSAAQPAPATTEDGAEPQAEQVSVGQLAVRGLSETLGMASLPTSSQSGVPEDPRAQDGVGAPSIKKTGRVRTADAQASDEAPAQDATDANISDTDSPKNLMTHKEDIHDEQRHVIDQFTERMAAEPDRELKGGLSDEVWKIAMDSMDKVPCCKSCLVATRRSFEHLGNLEAPPRSDPVSKFADSHMFETLIHITILLNSVFMFYAADQEIQHYDGDLPELVAIGEGFFLVAYSLEFVVKIWRNRLYYFVNSSWTYNWLDVFLLLLAAYSIFFEDSMPNFSWLRMLRMLRLFKVVRVLRLIAVVKPLRAILKSLFETLGTLFWSLTLMVLILALFSLVFVLRVATYLGDDSPDALVEEELLEKFGGIGVTLHHLFMATTGGNDWGHYYDALIPTGFINCAIFYFFVGFTQVAVLNIILGVFVDTAMKSMAGGKEEQMSEFADQQKRQEDDLRALCVAADVDKDGKLSVAEWRHALGNSTLVHYLESMDWRPGEVTDFLHLMSSKYDGAVDIEAFIRACMRFKGAASCYDMQIVMNALEDLRRYIRCAEHEHEGESLRLGHGVSRAMSAMSNWSNLPGRGSAVV